MKRIGFLSFGHWSETPYSQVRSASDALIQSIELAEAVEDLGGDGAYYRVHHFARQLASPFPLLAAVGARTTRIEIGTAVIDMRYENPFYMAEDAGAADIIAGGRLQLGISRGSPEQVIDGSATSAMPRPRARATPIWRDATPTSSCVSSVATGSPSPTRGPCSRTRPDCSGSSPSRRACANGLVGCRDAGYRGVDSGAGPEPDVVDVAHRGRRRPVPRPAGRADPAVPRCLKPQPDTSGNHACR